MSQQLFLKYLESTDEYSQMKLTEFLEKINDFSCFYYDFLDIDLPLDCFFEDQEVDFFLVDYLTHFEMMASNFFKIDTQKILSESSDAIELKAFRWKNIEQFPAHFNVSAIAKYQVYYQQILQQILEKETTVLDLTPELTKKHVRKISFNQAALLHFSASADYPKMLQRFETILKEDFTLTPEEFMKVFDKAFALLFDMTIEFSNDKTIVKPILLTMDIRIFDSTPIVKHRFIH